MFLNRPFFIHRLVACDVAATNWTLDGVEKRTFCAKFSRRSVAYFLKYLVVHVSAFWLQIAYFGLNFDDFSENRQKCEN